MAGAPKGDEATANPTLFSDSRESRNGGDIFRSNKPNYARITILPIRAIARHERARYPAATQTHSNGPSDREPVRREVRKAARRRGGGWNGADARRGAAINLEKHLFTIWGLQPLEIPQNRQSFLWKSLEKTSRDLESLEKRLSGAPRFRRLCSLVRRCGAGLEDRGLEVRLLPGYASYYNALYANKTNATSAMISRGNAWVADLSLG